MDSITQIIISEKDQNKSIHSAGRTLIFSIGCTYPIFYITCTKINPKPNQNSACSKKGNNKQTNATLDLLDYNGHIVIFVGPKTPTGRWFP